METTQYIKWSDGAVTKYKYSNHSQEEVIEMLKQDIHDRGILSTWVEDKNGNQIAYFDKHTQRIKWREELRKATKEEVFDKINNEVSVFKNDIKEVLDSLDSLEEQGYIKFKKEPKKEYKEYKVFVKTVIVYEGAKDLYYVTDSLYTDNIDEAKRFELDEEKDGYAYEIVKESV